MKALLAAACLAAACCLGAEGTDTASAVAPRAAPPVATSGANAEAALQAGQVRLQRGDEDGAESLWSAALARGEDSGLLYALGGLYFRQTRLADAETCFEHLARRSPELADAWYQLGLVRAARGHYRDAADAQRLAVGHSPTFGQAYCALALDLRESGQVPQGLAAAREALRLLPRYAGAWNLLGNLEQDGGQRDEAARCYRMALQLEPAYAGAWFNLAELQQKMNLPEDARLSFSRAVEAKPAFAEAHLARAELAMDQGHHQAAAQDFEALTRTDGWQAEGWWGLHRVAAARGRKAEATDDEQRYRRAVRRRDRLQAHDLAAGRETPSPYEPGLPLSQSGTPALAPSLEASR